MFTFGDGRKLVTNASMRRHPFGRLRIEWWLRLRVFRTARRYRLPIGDVVVNCARIDHRSGDEFERSNETQIVRRCIEAGAGVRRRVDRSVRAIRCEASGSDGIVLIGSWLGLPLSFLSDSSWAGSFGLSEDLQVELLVEYGQFTLGGGGEQFGRGGG